jgi:hypothetical protein
LVLMRPPCPKWITRLLAMPGLQIGSKSIERNTSILGGFGGIFSDRFGFLIADLENRRTDANRTPKSASKSARNRLDRTGLRGNPKKVICYLRFAAIRDNNVTTAPSRNTARI